MSVRVDQRKESQCEFLNTAHELEKYTIQLSMRENAIPKRYRFTLGLPLCNAARSLNQNITYANSIYPTTKYAAGTEHTTGGNEQFAYYATAANRIKSIGGAACIWWECSPNVSNSTNFCNVNTSGAANNNNASNANGVAP